LTLQTNAHSTPIFPHLLHSTPFRQTGSKKIKNEKNTKKLHTVIIGLIMFPAIFGLLTVGLKLTAPYLRYMIKCPVNKAPYNVKTECNRVSRDTAFVMSPLWRAHRHNSKSYQLSQLKDTIRQLLSVQQRLFTFLIYYIHYVISRKCFLRLCY